jgi:hypothetical protein
MGDLHDTVESEILPRSVSAAIREIGVGRSLLMPNVVRSCEVREIVLSLHEVTFLNRIHRWVLPIVLAFPLLTGMWGMTGVPMAESITISFPLGVARESKSALTYRLIASAGW